MSEQERFEKTMAQKTPSALIPAARRMASRINKAKPNWVIAMNLYCVGSTYAAMICSQAGLDPDATK